VVAHPETIVDIAVVDAETRDGADVDLAHVQEGKAGTAVTGEYSWESPEGITFVVKYIADELGYRVVESNAIPVNSDGLRSDGTQGDLDGDSTEDDSVEA
ncbi:unnamed protein product, partial [Meganyctiphanes norvegica]